MSQAAVGGTAAPRAGRGDESLHRVRRCDRPLSAETRVTYELRQHRWNSRNLSTGVIFGSPYLVRGSWPLIPALVAIPRKNGVAGMCLDSRCSYNHRVYASGEVLAKFHEDLPKCSSSTCAAMTFFTPSSRVDLNMMTLSIPSEPPGRGVRSFGDCNAFILPDYIHGCALDCHRGTPPGSSAPESDRGLSSFYLLRSQSCVAAPVR